jgi:DNA polymerase-3 subunit beta
MHIEIEKSDLISLLSRTQNIVEKRNAMPVLVNILLDASNNSLTIFATDLAISLTDKVPARVFSPGRVAVSSKNLFEIIKELGDQVKISLTKKENNWLEIRQGKYLSKIVGISAEEYPIFPAFSGTDFFKIDCLVVKEMIEKTIFSVSNDESRYHLGGVYFEKSPEKGLSMVATDGHRLSLIHKKIEHEQINLPYGVIIPRKGLYEVKKLVESVSGLLEMCIEGTQLVVRHLNTTLMIRLIEGMYPNYHQFIPQVLSKKVQINRDVFLSSLKRVSLLANHKSKAVTLALTKDKMEISSNNPELGDAKEEIEVNYSGNEIKLGFNARYIQDILQSIEEDEVDFEFNDQLSPGLLRPHSKKEHTCVIMPMRI